MNTLASIAVGVLYAEPLPNSTYLDLDIETEADYEGHDGSAPMTARDDDDLQQPKPFAPRTTPLLTRDDLVHALGWSFDPFRHSFSEAELEPNFSSIFVDPQPSLLHSLMLPHHTIVFGKYGAGKTATRRALEYVLRQASGSRPTLCVTYTPKIQDFLAQSHAQLLHEHMRQITTAAAVDIFVQFIERLDDEHRSLSAAQWHALDIVCGSLPVPLQRSLRTAASAPPDSGALWFQGKVNIRPLVRHVERSDQWMEVMRRIATRLPAHPSRPSWDSICSASARLGFGKIFLVVDAVDEGVDHPDDLALAIEPLLDRREAFEREGVLLKAFVPMMYKPLYDERYHEQNDALTAHIDIARIEQATVPHLQEIIRERLRAASQSHDSLLSLDVLSRDDVDENIEQRLAELAGGSPRRLIWLASKLLDEHVDQGFNDPKQPGRLWLTEEEWQSFLQQVDRLGLAPP